jgi:hypothetical protein
VKKDRDTTPSFNIDFKALETQNSGTFESTCGQTAELKKKLKKKRFSLKVPNLDKVIKKSISPVQTLHTATFEQDVKRIVITNMNINRDDISSANSTR